uniref:Uncharacterized protein n=1 Tax=Moniliophthora roreri TaxID=221103 RepID=A0A0W0FUS7_MONRR
MFVQAVVICLR